MLEILSIIVALLLSAVWYLTKTFDYWKDKKVVGKRPYPIFGTSASEFYRRLSPSLAAAELYNQFPNEKLIGGFQGPQPFLIVKDAEIIKQVLVRDFESFIDRDLPVNPEYEPLTQHLFFVNGDKWRTLRHKLTPTFTSCKMRKMFHLMVTCGEEFQVYLKTIVEQNKTPEIKDLVAKYMTDVIGSCAFGIKTNSMKDENSTFKVMGSRAFAPSLRRTIKVLIRQISPKLYKLLGLKFFDEDVETFFLSLVHSIMNTRDNQPSLRHDFVDILMELKLKGYIESDSFKSEEKIQKIEISDNLLSAQAFMFFVAGFETSSTTVAFALHELAFYQDIQTKVAIEIETVLSKLKGQITYDALKEMEYLKMVVDETLRKYPPIGLLIRSCKKACQFTGTNVKIDKGVLVRIPVHALHHDAKYYPEPEKFIPERFDSTTRESINPHVYLPFGEGPRGCVAVRFARLQVMLGLISILRDYRVVPKESTKRDLKFTPHTVVLISKDGIHLNLESRY